MDIKTILAWMFFIGGFLFKALDWVITATNMPGDVATLWRENVSQFNTATWITLIVGVMMLLWTYWPLIRNLDGSLLFGANKIPISKASALMYNMASPKTAKFITGNSTIDVYQKPENYFSWILLIYARSDSPVKLVLFGRRGESLKQEVIPPTELKRLRIVKHSKLEGSSWVDVRVRRKDAISALKHYESESNIPEIA